MSSDQHDLYESQNPVHMFRSPSIRNGTSAAGRHRWPGPWRSRPAVRCRHFCISQLCACWGGGGFPKGHVIKSVSAAHIRLDASHQSTDINVPCLQCRRQSPQRHPPKRPRPSPRPSPRRSQLASQAKSPAKSLASGRQRNPQRSRISLQRGPAKGSRPEGSRSQGAGSCSKATCSIISV